MNSSSSIRLHAGDALIAIDVQNDFLPGGSLAVPAGDAVVPALNRYLAAFGARALGEMQRLGARAIRHEDLAP